MEESVPETISEEDGNWQMAEFATLFLAEDGKYSDVIQLNENRTFFTPKLLSAQVKSLIFTHKYNAALELLQASPDKNLPELIKLKGECLYQIGEYETSKRAFERCFNVSPTPDVIRWIQRCEVQMSRFDQISRRNATLELHCNPNSKRDWDQTITHVILSYNIKDTWKDNVDIKVNDNYIEVNFKKNNIAKCGYYLYKPLSNEPPEINSQTRTLEIHFKKVEPELWPIIEISQEIQTEKKTLNRISKT